MAKEQTDSDHPDGSNDGNNNPERRQNASERRAEVDRRGTGRSSSSTDRRVNVSDSARILSGCYRFRDPKALAVQQLCEPISDWLISVKTQ